MPNISRWPCQPASRRPTATVTLVIKGFSHVQLVVRDVAVSAPWYCEVLGLEQFVTGTTASGDYAGLRHPTARFVIGMQTATPEQASDLRATTIDHLSFAVADRPTLDAMRTVLLARGIAIGEVFEEAVSYNARIRDPDGLVLELSAPKP
jgi:catechol 2,3-dioxygenase-like lactoylglutathione lyase family enzyme